MKLVLDACVAISMLVPEDDSPAALALREDSRNKIHDLIAPDCVVTSDKRLSELFPLLTIPLSRL